MRAGWSDAGLMPITASPAPYIRPSAIEAMMPAAIVGRMVRLQAHGHRARQADGVAERRHDPALARRQDQVLVAHQLRDGGGDLGRDGRRQRGAASAASSRATAGARAIRRPSGSRSARKARASCVSRISRVTSSSS